LNKDISTLYGDIRKSSNIELFWRSYSLPFHIQHWFHLCLFGLWKANLKHFINSVQTERVFLNKRFSKSTLEHLYLDHKRYHQDLNEDMFDIMKTIQIRLESHPKANIYALILIICCYIYLGRVKKKMIIGKHHLKTSKNQLDTHQKHRHWD
jgi:hypothetical protein